MTFVRWTCPTVMSWMTPFSRACVTGRQDFTATMVLHVKVAAQTSGVLHCLLLHAVSVAWLSMHTSHLHSHAFSRVQVQQQCMTHQQCMTRHYAACTLCSYRMPLTIMLSCLSHDHFEMLQLHIANRCELR